MTGTQRSEEIDLREVVQLFKRNWKLFGFILLLGLAVSAAYYKLSKRVFDIRSLVLIDYDDHTQSPSDILFESSGGNDDRKLNNEMVMLKAHPLVKQTIEELGLDVQYYLKDFLRTREIYANCPIVVSFSPKSPNIPYGSEFWLTLLDDGKYKVEADLVWESLNKEERLEETGTFGTPFKHPLFTFTVGFRANAANDVKGEPIGFIPRNSTEFSSFAGAALNVSIMQDQSSIIALKMESSTPQKWIRFMNGLVENYTAQSLTEKNRTSQNTIEFIDSELKGISDSLKAISAKLERVRTSGKGVQSPEAMNKVNEQLLDLEIELSSHLLQKRYFTELFGSLKGDGNIDSSLLSPGVFGSPDPLLNGLMEEYVSLKRNYDILVFNKQDNSPHFEQIKFRLISLRQEVLKNLQKMHERNDMQVASLQEQVAKLKQSYANFPQLERQMIDLNRDFELNEKLFLLLTEKKTEAEITKSSNVSDLRVVEKARQLSKTPKFPNLWVMVIGFAMSFALAFLIVLGKSFSDNKIRTHADLKAIGDISFLGELQQVKSHGTHYILNNPKSGLAESFRIIRQNLNFFHANSKAAPVFMVSSFIPGEGKTFVATQLSLINRATKKVILIDGDLRRPQVQKTLGLRKGLGLSDYLSGQAMLEEVLHYDETLGIQYITAGTIPPNPTELLGSQRMKDLLEHLKTESDYIVMDAPPLNIISDAFILEGQVSSTVIVTRSGYTPKDAITFYQDQFQKGKIKSPAFVLNGVKNHSSYTYEYKYGYYEQGNGKGLSRLSRLFKWG